MNNADIKKVIENLLNNMGVSFDAVDVIDDKDTGKTVFAIKTLEPTLLIGDEGENFYALTHIVRRIAGKGLEDSPDFSIDVNDYRSGLVEKLKIKAGILANRARDMKSNVEMEPMSSYERLIIHGSLTNEKNIKTGSVGVGKDRRVIIKYIED